MTECPSCGGNIYDNRQKVADGWKGPLFKCKDQECGWKKWAPKGQQQKGGPKGNGFSAGPKWTWEKLSGMYAKSLAIADKHVKNLVPNALPADVIAATATLFIAATRDGIKPPPPKEPEPVPVEEEDDLPY